MTEASNELIELWLQNKVDLRVNEHELYGRRIELTLYKEKSRGE